MSATIECRPNGPYLVKGELAVRNSAGEAIATEAVFALCRCGGSSNKPFCDGTHKKNGFSSARIAGGSDDKLDLYRGAAITIRDNRSICAHAGYCTDGLPGVFKDGTEPWIDPDGAAAQAIIETVRKCPSGALSYSVDGTQPMAEARAPAITVTKDGPYTIVGGVDLLDAHWGKGASREHYTLCRCGASKNKPFCDGTHWDIGFDDAKGQNAPPGRV